MAMARADKARSYTEYLQDLKAYQKSFQDGHVEFSSYLQEKVHFWPGFILYGTSLTNMSVVFALPDAGVKVGARLISCDGKSVDRLLEKYTDLYNWNRAIPHDRFRYINRVFRKTSDNKGEEVDACTFSTGKVALKWQKVSQVQVTAISASGVEE